MNGFLPFLKPPGMTSSDAVIAIRRLLPRGTRVGHAGTLDPDAAGVLPVMIGKATRLFDFLTDSRKEYVAEWIPGLATDTLDIYGKEIAREEAAVSDADLSAALRPGAVDPAAEQRDKAYGQDDPPCAGGSAFFLPGPLPAYSPASHRPAGDPHR